VLYLQENIQTTDGLLLACDTCGIEVIQSQGQGHTHETFCDDHFDCDKCNKQFADIQCLNEHKAKEHQWYVLPM
jgi:hypothetical protein